mgnify:FL=1
MIERRKNAVALTIERFFIFQMRRRKAAALMIERLFVLRKEERKKAAALTIERIFIMEKAAVDLEIVRQQRQSSKNKLRDGDDDQLLDKAWEESVEASAKHLSHHELGGKNRGQGADWLNLNKLSE